MENKLSGEKSRESTLIVTKHAIKSYARAVDNANPVYYSEESAAAAGFAGVIAPASFLGQYNLIKMTVDPGDLVPQGGVHTRQVFQFRGIIRAGDYLNTRIATVATVDAKGRKILEYHMTAVNQRGETVYKGIMTNTMPQS